MYRVSAMLNIHAERTSEKMVTEALQSALGRAYPPQGGGGGQHGVATGRSLPSMVDFSAEVDARSLPQRYNLLCEFSGWPKGDSQGSGTATTAADDDVGGSGVDGEGGGPDSAPGDLERLATEVEAELCHLNATYARDRGEGYIGPLGVCRVKEGTFAELFSMGVERGADPSQYKVPRCVNGELMRGVLRAGVVEAATAREGVIPA
ncbi:unnamed protein product [Discosporangium mesarthrocarpum]